MRKQSLVQRPSCWMSQRGSPAAAAVVAAPILREWDDTGDLGSLGMALFSSELRRRRVRRLLFSKVNSGPDLSGCCLI